MVEKISNANEVKESKSLDAENFKEIKPEGEASPEEAKDFIDGLFESVTYGLAEEDETDNEEKNIEKLLEEYFKDLKDKSECPETILDNPFDFSELKKRTPEENSELREEFSEIKAQLKREWEETNGRPWPKYENDVYSVNGKLIREAGSDYDAHHVQPLSMGGKNDAKNITPLNAEVHYDKQGVHAPDSPYSKLDKMLGGME